MPGAVVVVAEVGTEEVGWKVATNGVCTGDGKTTGTLSTGQRSARGPQFHRDDAGGVDHLREPPTWMVPGPDSVDPVAVAVARTQHGSEEALILTV